MNALYRFLYMYLQCSQECVESKSIIIVLHVPYSQLWDVYIIHCFPSLIIYYVLYYDITSCLALSQRTC